MQFSVGVEYAFHSLFYLDRPASQKTVGIREIARLNGIADAYLSKVFSKLRQVGVVRSVPGVKGGYELAKDPAAISFWDIIEAIEGPSFFFRCAELRKKNVFRRRPEGVHQQLPLPDQGRHPGRRGIRCAAA